MPKTNWIKEWRKFRGLTQEQLAVACGKSTATISRIENGKQSYNQVILEKAAHRLDTIAVQLLWGPPPTEEERLLLEAFTAADEAKRRWIIRVVKATDDTA